jgi:hypothetical protein
MAVFAAALGTRLDQDTTPARIPDAKPLRNGMCSSRCSPARWPSSLRRTTGLRSPTSGTFSLVNRRWPLWNQNACGIWLNRRVGLGRVNVGKAVELARDCAPPSARSSDSWQKRPSSFRFHVTAHAFVLVMTVEIQAENLGFASLVVWFAKHRKNHVRTQVSHRVGRT